MTSFDAFILRSILKFRLTQHRGIIPRTLDPWGGESLHASIEFPTDRYLIELSSSSQSQSPSHQNYEYITIRDVMLDGNYRSGGIAVVNSLRTSLDNLYIVHFSSDGIFVKGGHEIYVRNSYLGQHITAGGDPRERERFYKNRYQSLRQRQRRDRRSYFLCWNGHFSPRAGEYIDQCPLLQQSNRVGRCRNLRQAS